MCIEGVGGGEVADGCLFCFGGAVEAVENLFENTAVFAVVRPEEAAVFVAAETVDKEGAWSRASLVCGTKTASVPHRQHLTRRGIRPAGMSRQRVPAFLV